MKDKLPLPPLPSFPPIGTIQANVQRVSAMGRMFGFGAESAMTDVYVTRSNNSANVKYLFLLETDSKQNLGFNNVIELDDSTQWAYTRGRYQF